jgi:hypothetical protein
MSAPFPDCPYTYLSVKLTITILGVADMSVHGRCFPYEKSIVINALYDTIEALGLCLDNSDSVRGRLAVSGAGQTGKMRIVLSVAGKAEGTQVDIFLESSDKDAGDAWSTVVFDELAATIKKACHVRRNCTKEEEI